MTATGARRRYRWFVRRPGVVRQRFEALLWIVALVCIVGFVADRSRSAAAQAAARQDLAAALADTGANEPDRSRWSASRARRYEESLRLTDRPAPLGRLLIPAAGIDVFVFDGVNDRVLDIGAGRVPGTAPFDGEGNLAIAAHRDGFFRGLRDVAAGDEIRVVSVAGQRRYRVDDISIVEPDDVGVLAPTDTTGVTLITCYPFYFVGSAPLRYIVHAELLADLQ